MRAGWLIGGCLFLLATEPHAEPILKRGLPLLSSANLDINSFDVRAFDPIGMLPAQQHRKETSAKLEGVPSAELRLQEALAVPSDGFFSDGWSRNGFNSQP